MKVRLNQKAQYDLCHNMAAYPWKREIGELGYQDNLIVEIIWPQGSNYFLRRHVTFLGN